jgi:hypothetical protein
MGDPDKRLVMIHGRGMKPPREALAELWRAALRRGVERDHGKLVAQLDRTDCAFVYYGDLLQQILAGAGAQVDEALDLADLHTALAELAERDSKKQFRSQNYHRMRWRSGTGKLLMQLSSPFARGLRLDERLVARMSPELARYRSDPDFAQALRARLMGVLAPSLERGDEVMLVAHCLGSVVAYDCLWLLSRGSATLPGKLRTFVTLGSPLANDIVRMGLLGAGEPLEQRYPGNITQWFNLAAEDDYVCHDNTVANDFGAMLDRRAISRLEDYGVFNLARRYGRPNPHNALGYLIHPRMSALVADWLAGTSRGSSE